MSSTADMLRQLRESTGLNQKDFAASVGMKQTTYNGYETGKHRPKSDVLITIAAKYNVSVDYLLGFSNDGPDTTRKSPNAADAASGDMYDLSPRMDALHAAMDQLNEQGQEKVLEYANDLVSSDNYIKSNPAGLGKEA